MKKIYCLLFILLLFSFSSSLFSQPTSTLVGGVVMPAPNAGSLGKYGDIPVSLYTGTPNISIPIYTVVDGSLNLPISLDYHSSGIRVAETASWVGIGWSLQAGGIITRVTQGTDDDKLPGGYYHHGANDLNIGDGFSVGVYNDGQFDSESDIYSFNVTGYSGKFIFDSNKKAHFIPKQDLKLETNLDGGMAGNFDQFTLITPDGTRYSFGKDPLEPTRKALEYTYAGGEAFNKATASSWYLVRVESHDKKHSIKLLYDSETYGYKNLAGRRYVNATYSGGTCGSGFKDGVEDTPMPGFGANHHYVQTSVSGKRLSQIISSTATINFNVDNTNREDLGLDANSTNTSKKLEAIEINTGSYCSKFKLSHDYFEDKVTTVGTILHNQFRKRLKLLSVQQTDCNNTAANTIPPYVFEYEEEIRAGVSYLPHRLNKGIDHWGFYNGADGSENGRVNNENLIVNTPSTRIEKNGTIYEYGTAYRETDFNYSKIGALKKITYPTGGHTEFIFESNKYLGEIGNGPTIQRLYLDNDSCVNQNGQYDPTFCCGTYNLEGEYTFISLDQIGDMHFWLQLGAGCSSSLYSIKLDAYLKSDNTHIGHFEFNNQDYAELFPLSLLEQNGVFESSKAYLFKVEIINGTGNFTLQEKPTTFGSKDVGGLRVKEIRTYDGINVANDIIKTYDYVDNNGGESGSLSFPPYYAVDANYSATCEFEDGIVHAFTSTQVNGVIFFDQSYVPLSSFDGRHVTYSHVKESLNGNGYKTYKYISSIDYQNFYNPTYPATPAKLNPYHGKPTYVKQYNENNAIIAETNTAAQGNPLTYTLPNTIYKFTSGITFKGTPSFPGSGGNSSELHRMYLSIPYQMETSVYRVAQVEEIIDNVSTITTYEYDYDYFDGNPENDHYFPTKINITNSDSTTYTTHNEYPFNFSGAVYDSMVSRNMIATPIRTTIEVDGNQIDGSYQICDFFNSSGAPDGSGNDPIYPKIFQRYETTWDENGSPVTGIWDLQGTILEYDMTVGKPKRFQQHGWEEETYTWDATNKQLKTRNYKDFTWTYNYHPNTRLLSEIIDIDGQDTDFGYDQLMRLQTVTARDGHVITNYAYHFDDGSSGDYNYVKTRTDFTPISDSDLHWTESWQYLDGLGRPLQTVQRRHASDEKDVIIGAVSYDNQGRISKQFEPFTGGNNTGSFTTIPAGQKYTLSEYYASPLNRIHKATPPDWFATTYEYGNNSSSIDIGGTIYNPSSLYTSKVIDPEGIESIAYTDKRGRVLLSKNKRGSNETNTFTLYDNKDRVKTILPPDVISATSALAYQYQYDGADNIIKKFIPDMGWSEMLYDDRNLLTASQDPNLLAENKWLTSIYDGYGRVLQSGFHENAISGVPNPNTPTIDYTLTSTFYDQNCSNSANLSQFTGKVCYETRRILNTGSFLNNEYNYDVFGRMVYSKGNNHLDLTPESQKDSLHYDYADNVTRIRREHRALGNTQTIIERIKYDHAGRVENTYHQYNGQNEEWISNTTYTIKDELMRKSLGGINNGASYLQKVDYSYLANGFLQHINQTMSGDDLFKLELNYDQGSGTFAPAQKNGNISQLIWQVKGKQEQTYGFEYDYLNRLTKATSGTYSPGRTSLDIHNDYGTNYTYDNRGNIMSLDRNGVYSDGNTWQSQQIDNLSYQYYPNSNKIKTITDGAGCPNNKVIQQPVTRSQVHAASNILRGKSMVSGDAIVNYQAGTRIVLDEGFSISAEDGGRFTVGPDDCPISNFETDGFVQRSTDDLEYDENGNLKVDPHKKISIEYNYLNLPIRVTSTDNNGQKVIEWLYDANGTKLQKKVLIDTTIILTQDYINGVEYREDTLAAIYHGEGRLYFQNGEGRYEYTLTDHLGNTRITFSDLNGNNVIEEATEVLQENHYYPYGMAMKGDFISNVAKKNKYLFNGIERNDDFGLGWDMAEFRAYNPAIARWMQIDPLGELTPSWTAYRHAYNNPIRNSDFYGLTENDEVEREIEYDEDGKPTGVRIGYSNSNGNQNNNSNIIILGLPIDLGAENIIQEIADGLKNINALTRAYYDFAGDDDAIMSYHDYQQSLKDKKRGAPFWPIFAKYTCDYSCVENNFEFSGDQSGGGWNYKKNGLSISISRENQVLRLGGKVSHIEFRDQQVVTGTSSATEYSILLQIQPKDSHRPAYSIISIKTRNKGVYEAWKSYIND